LKDTGARVVPVGRLDFHTSGALLCTNDGEFAQALAHPKREVPKVYVAKVKGAVDDDALERFRKSIVIDERPTQPAQVRRLRFEGDKTWLEITLKEGRNRQVRRLGEATGFPVMRLARISHAGISSEDLRPGQWRPLSIDELADLKKRYGVPKKVRAPELALVEHGKRERKVWARREDRGSAQPSRRSAKFEQREDRGSAQPSRRSGKFEQREDRGSAQPSRRSGKFEQREDRGGAQPSRRSAKSVPLTAKRGEPKSAHRRGTSR
jgi:23S rRNA pseudouridine2605 synthase